MTQYLGVPPSGTNGQWFESYGFTEQGRIDGHRLAAEFEARHGYEPDFVFSSGPIILAGPIRGGQERLF